ncbi:thiolase family protein [Helcococcus bovis]|uniref:thiolase family protein n=1 Tax=Helcococcus bovis TaxID=3153252 RepID=UPI0038BD69BE
MNKKNRIVFLSGVRTPIGKFLGKLRSFTPQKLGKITLKEAIKRAKIDKNEIDEIIVGNVISTPTACNLASVIGLDLELKEDFTAMTVNRICGSGLQSAISGYQELFFDKKKVIAVGGIETMSRAPFQLEEDSRFNSKKLGNIQMLDANIESLKSASGTNSEISNMGITAENIAKKYNISRTLQDEYALNSHLKAIKATSVGRFKEEMFSIEVSENGKKEIIEEDLQIREDISIEKLQKLKPAFLENGTVTAGNSSSFNDGAAFEIMTTEKYAIENNLDIMAYFVDYSIVGVLPDMMGLGPVEAIKQLCKYNDLDLEKDIDYLEINEAFSAQVIGCLKELGISLSSEFYKNRFNVNGGALALGHPLGMSGSRLINTVLHEFKNNPLKRYAIVSACIGGGQGIAILLENGYFNKNNK